MSSFKKSGVLSFWLHEKKGVTFFCWHLIKWTREPSSDSGEGPASGVLHIDLLCDLYCLKSGVSAVLHELKSRLREGKTLSLPRMCEKNEGENRREGGKE